MTHRVRSSARLGLAVALSLLIPAAAFALDIQGVQNVALDQPRINAALVLPGSTSPLTATTTDLAGNPVQTFNIQAFYDTGASGVLVSKETADALGLTRLNGVEFHDVGVGGVQPFDVSQLVNVRLAPFPGGADLDDLNNFPGPYTQAFGPLHTQVAQTAAPLIQGPLDVFGIPLFQGKTAVFDARPVNQIAGTIITHVYNSGNVPGTVPQPTYHVQMSFADLSRYTNASDLGNQAPTLNANPFIGPSPLGAGGASPPGITITRDTGSTTLASTGSWLFDTGAVTSMISTTQATAVGVSYSTDPNQGLGSDNPTLVDENGDPLPDQFILAIGGVGGTVKAAGFWLDTLTLQTAEGEPIIFKHAPVLVNDISVLNPHDPTDTLTLDGVFGMNYLVASAFLTAGQIFPSKLTAGAFDFFEYDQTANTLGLVVPEPGTLAAMAVGAAVLTLQRKRKK